MMYSRYTPNGNGGFDRRAVPGNLRQSAASAPETMSQLPKTALLPPLQGDQKHAAPPPAPPVAEPPVCPLQRPGQTGAGMLHRLLPEKLERGDLLMLAILYLVFSEEDEDPLLPLLAVGLYLLLK